MTLLLPWPGVLVLLVLAQLAGCGAANNLRLRQANDNLTMQWTVPAPTAQLQAEFSGYRPFIRVRVNAQTELSLLVDSGAAFSVLWDTAAVRRLQLKRGYPLAVGGFGTAADSAAYQSVLSSLEVGPARFSEVQVALVPRAGTGYFLQPDEAVFDGVMGYDLMRHFSWEFDRLHGRIQLSSLPYVPKPTELMQPFEINWRKVVVKSQIQLNSTVRLAQDLLLDTGSRHFLKINALYLQQRQLRLDGPLRDGADFGLSGRHANQRGEIINLQLGSQHLAPVPVNLMPADDADDWWVLGSGVLMQHRLVLDYLSAQWLIQPQHAAPYQARSNLTGLELRKLSSGFFIVRDNLNPQLQGWLAPGDQLVQIAGLAATAVDEWRWIELSSTAGSLQLCKAASRPDCRDIRLLP